MPKQDLLEQDIQAIIEAGGLDTDVENYLKESGVSYNVSGTETKPQDQFLPGRTRVEELRGGRKPITTQNIENLVKSFKGIVAKETGEADTVARMKALPNPFLSGAGSLMDIADVTESGLASAGLKAQEGGNIKDIIGAFHGDDVIGRPAQFGDIPRSAGVPEPLSAAIGLGTAMAVPDIINLVNLKWSNVAKDFKTIKGGINKVGRGISSLLKSGTSEFLNLGNLFKKSAPQIYEARKALYRNIGEETGRLATTTTKLKDEAGAIIEGFGKKTTGLTEKLASEKEELAKTITTLKDNISAATEASKSNKTALMKSLVDDATNKTLKTREAIPSLIEAETATYKAGLEAVSQDLGEISLRDAQGILGKTIVESNASFLRGDTLETIKKLGQKYLNSKKTSFDFRDLKADFDQILNSVEYGKRATSEAIPAYILRKQLGSYITDVRKIDSFKPLQDTYSETVEILKFADEYFRPRGNVMQAGRGVALLERFGLGESKIGEKEMLGKLQGRLGQDITSSLFGTGKEIQQLTESTEQLTNNLSREIIDKAELYKNTISGIKQEISQIEEATENLKNTLTREVASRTDISKDTIASIQKEIEKRTIQYNNRLRAENLLKKMAIITGLGAAAKGVDVLSRRK